MKFISENWRGVLVFSLGVVVLVATYFFLDVCADHGHLLETAKGTQVNMRCSWTERAIQSLGGLVVVMGLIMIFARQAAQALSLTVAFTGALMIMVPIWLIPTCMSADMPCNLSFKPGALLLSGLILLAGLAGAIKWNRIGEA